MQTATEGTEAIAEQTDAPSMSVTLIGEAEYLLPDGRWITESSLLGNTQPLEDTDQKDRHQDTH